MLPKNKKHSISTPEKNGEAMCGRCKHFHEECRSMDGRTTYGFCNRGKTESLGKGKEFFPEGVCDYWICKWYESDE